MKTVVLSFGLIGFLVVALGGFQAGRQPEFILRDAALACLATAMLGRWFWNRVVAATEQAVRLRHRAALATAATQNESNESAPPAGAATPPPPRRTTSLPNQP